MPNVAGADCVPKDTKRKLSGTVNVPVNPTEKGHGMMMRRNMTSLNEVKGMKKKRAWKVGNK